VNNSRVWRTAHRKEIRAYRKVYNAAHREERKTYNKAWRAAHREEKKIYQKAYRVVHRKEIKAYRVAHRGEHSACIKTWNAAHPEKRSAIGGRSKAKRRNYEYNVLNDYFLGAVGHHVTDTEVVYIPGNVHVSCSYGSQKEKHRKKVMSLYGGLENMIQGCLKV